MQRWLVVSLGLALGLAALWLLATARREAPSHGVIDDSSRERLERVLRQANDPETTRR